MEEYLRIIKDKPVNLAGSDLHINPLENLELKNLESVKNEIESEIEKLVLQVSELGQDFNTNIFSDFNDNLINILVKTDLTEEHLKGLFGLTFIRIQQKFYGENNIGIREKLGQNLIHLFGAYLKNIVFINFPLFPIPKFSETSSHIEMKEIINQIIQECFQDSQDWSQIEKIMETKLLIIMENKIWTQKNIQELIENLVNRIILKLAKNELKRRLIKIFYDTLTILDQEN